jgi:hypothetical protein
MTDTLPFRDQLRDLAERLVLEYAGSLPPGQVMAAVYRSHRSVTGVHPAADSGRLSLCELVARAALTERLALARH